MAFTACTEYQTISATDLNNNFYHIAQGHWLPMGGAALDTTTGVYDLGSDTYRWNNIYVTNLNITGEMQQTFNLVSTVTLTTTATSIEFTGLDGNTDEIYEVCANLLFDQTTASYVYFHFNGDSGTNYGYQFILGLGAAVSALRQSATGMMYTYLRKTTATASLIMANMIIYANSGYERLALIHSSEASGATYAGGDLNIAAIWNDTASTITSIKFMSGAHKFRTGSTISLYAKR